MQRFITKRRIGLFFTILLLLAVPTGASWAAPAADKEVSANDVIRNDIVLIDEDLTLEDGGRVTGDIIIFNGNADIAGTVNGDVVIFNGNLTASDTAVLNGDCVLFNGSTAGEGSISCTNLNVMLPEGLNNFVGLLAESGEFGSGATIEVEQPSMMSRILTGTAVAAARALLLGLLAFAAASLIPQPMLRIEDAIRQKPVASGAIGLLTFFSAPFVLVIFAVISAVLILACGLGLLGFPLMGAMVLALLAAGFLGWFTVGSIVGEFLVQRLNLKNRGQALTTALGTATITFILGFLGAVPFVIGESVVWWVIVFLGLGATALTKFGTRAYPLVAAGPPLDQDKITAVLDTLPDKENMTE